jgi:hypothetical protein
LKPGGIDGRSGAVECGGKIRGIVKQDVIKKVVPILGAFWGLLEDF